VYALHAPCPVPATFGRRRGDGYQLPATVLVIRPYQQSVRPVINPMIVFCAREEMGDELSISSLAHVDTDRIAG